MDEQQLRDHLVSCRDKLEGERPFEEVNGACHENAIYLLEYLQSNTEIPLYLRWGAVDVHRDITTVKESEQCDPPRTHFWVETHIDGEWFYLDVFTMSSAPDGISRGQVLCVDKLPVYYHTPQDSLFVYQNTITANDLLNYTDYQYLCQRYEQTTKENVLG